MVTPDGKYLAFSAYNADIDATRNSILDVASGKLTRIDSENELSASSMIGTMLYVTGNGAAVVDLTTGKATPMQSGTAPIAVSEGFGVFNAADAFVVAPTS